MTHRHSYVDFPDWCPVSHGELDRRLHALESEMQKQLDRRLRELESRLQTEMDGRLKDLWSYVMDQTEAITRIGEQTVATQADLDALAQALADENSELNTAVAGIQAEIADLQNQDNDLDLSGLQAQVDALKGAVDSAAALVPAAPPADGS